MSSFKSTWRYANSQNAAISLMPIYPMDKIKLILYPRVRNSIPHLIIIYIKWNIYKYIGRYMQLTVRYPL